MTSGIYKITNTLTGKIYIGASQNITARFYQHKSTLNSNSHRCASLQQDWNLYGQRAFDFSIIQEVEIEDLTVMEKYHIEKNLNGCYNQRLGGYALSPGLTKVRYAIIVKENLLNQFKTIAKLEYRNLSTASEVALELFVKEFGPLYGIALTPEPSPELEQVSRC